MPVQNFSSVVWLTIPERPQIATVFGIAMGRAEELEGGDGVLTQLFTSEQPSAHGEGHDEARARNEVLRGCIIRSTRTVETGQVTPAVRCRAIVCPECKRLATN